jgi:hypothetical protein
VTVNMKLLEQFEPAHCRQIGVDQQAFGFVRMKRVEKRLAAFVGALSRRVRLAVRPVVE